ncbi:MAG TPA: BMP family ABC transporter substrate-binding protein, partial [Oscillospiraceae bacterium]|nr:BMP family ABC transporter substrate-binding protein [Oscillospiraceae bacterium]
MKKILALILAAVMVFAFAACGGEEPAEPTNPGESTPVETSEEPAETVLSEAAQRVLATKGEKLDTTKVKDAFDAGTLKVGVILLHDENTGYDAAHLNGIKEAAANVGLTEDQVIWKYNIPEDETCYDTAVDLAEAGCQVVISDSYGHQSYMLQAAQEYPDVIFMPATGDNAAASGLTNLVNFFPHTYESRYVSGVVAGMKLAELVADGKITDANKDGENIKIGYVGAFPYAEVVSGYTAFYLGIKSIVPNVVMDVTYTSSWYDPTAESAAANALVSRGCVIISQHADSTGAPSACQALLDAGTTVYCVGYNIDM